MTVYNNFSFVYEKLISTFKISYLLMMTLILFKGAFCFNETVDSGNYSNYYTSLAEQFGEVIGPQNGKNETEVLYQLLQEYHEYKIRWLYQKRQYWATSNVGSLMFKNNMQHHYKSKNKTFVIFVWNQWYPWFKSRHMARHLNGNPLEECSVKNCVVTNDEFMLRTADAVVIQVQYGIIPRARGRNPAQRWIFLSDESPKNVFAQAIRQPKLSEWANVFNWTMTYRTDSDVPIPYGRTLPLWTYLTPSEIPESLTDLVPYWKIKRRDVLLTVLMSACAVTARMSYIQELQKYIRVDVYGQCSLNNKNSCPGRYVSDCPILNNYVFYLAFENSQCRQYITEKTFYNSYMKGAIPIIMGAPKEDCDKLLPLHSFIHVENFSGPKELSDYIRRLNMNDDRLLMYHQWRRFFKVVNEHGYSGTKSFAVCRLCEALNYNDDRPKVYTEDDLKLFFDYKLLCNLTGKDF